jgi:hypothetical protein
VHRPAEGRVDGGKKKLTESMVEDDEHDANDLLEMGLEQALSLKKRMPSRASSPT